MIDLKFFFIINSYFNYKKKFFKAKYIAYKTNKLHKSKFLILLFTFFFPLLTLFLLY